VVLDAVALIVHYRTSSTEAALKALGSPEARRVAVALRLRRRRGTLLYRIAERALFMEAMGVDRRVATELLASELRLRLEDEHRRARELYNFAVFAASMAVFTALVVGVFLAPLSPEAASMASLVAALEAVPLAALERLCPPARRWNYGLAAAAMAPAALSLAEPWLSLLAAPAAALYGVYYIRRLREAGEELAMAMRGQLTHAETDTARQAAEIMRAVRTSGAYDLMAAAEYMMRVAEAHLSSLRREGLMRALVIVSLVIIAAAAAASFWPQLAFMAEQVKGGPLKLYVVSARPAIGALALVSAAVAGRLTESYAAAPLYSPLAIAQLFVP
jgi:hypothetical protein